MLTLAGASERESTMTRISAVAARGHTHYDIALAVSTRAGGCYTRSWSAGVPSGNEGATLPALRAAVLSSNVIASSSIRNSL